MSTKEGWRGELRAKRLDDATLAGAGHRVGVPTRKATFSWNGVPPARVVARPIVTVRQAAGRVVCRVGACLSPACIVEPGAPVTPDSRREERGRWPRAR